eukprot:520606-Hanusia_phi.AAC.2
MVVVKKPMFTHMQPSGMRLDRPYEPYKEDKTKWIDRSNGASLTAVFMLKHSLKWVNGIVATLFGVVTIVLAIITLAKPHGSTFFPTSIVTHSIHPWNRLDKLNAALLSLNGTQGSLQANVAKLWDWSGCDGYITTGDVPSETSKFTLGPVSSSKPVYMPGGCNCLAQVGHAIGATWSSTQTTSPTKDEVADMVRFCVYEGDMPATYEPRSATYRPLFYFYVFMMLASGGVALANFMHSGSVDTVRYLLNTSQQDNSEQRDKSMQKLTGKAILTAIVIAAVMLSFTISFLTSCNSCDQGMHAFNLLIPMVFLVLFLVVCFAFVVPYLYCMSEDNLQQALQVAVSAEQSTDASFSNMPEYEVSDALNAQAQLEQLWTDIMLIPAFVMLRGPVAP